MNPFKTQNTISFWKILAAFSFLLAICFLTIYKKKQGFTQKFSNRKLNNAIDKISEAGYYIVGSSSCGYCTKQLQALGKNVDKIKFYDCAKDDTMCKRHAIDGFPTWVSPDGTLDPGFKPEETLIEMANNI